MCNQQWFPVSRVKLIMAFCFIGWSQKFQPYLKMAEIKETLLSRFTQFGQEHVFSNWQFMEEQDRAKLLAEAGVCNRI